MTLLRFGNFTFIALLFLFFGPVRGQQALEPMQANPRLKEIWKLERQNTPAQQSKSSSSGVIQVNLANSKVIFKDDFSSYSGWPSPKKWVDNEVFINNSFGNMPVSLGVATFDGLDPMGEPYDIASPSTYGENDHLTSCPIDLSVIDLSNPLIDSVVMSFYYQPQGKNPFGTEKGDSLILEFLDQANKTWDIVWSVDGGPLIPFTKKTMIIEPKYYTDSFQFRFTNFGNQTGNVDHWHLDYIYLTSQKVADHQALEDMAIRNPIYTLLKDYTAMPWWHYNTSRMLEQFDLNYYYFNSSKTKSPDIRTSLRVLDSNEVELFSTTTNSPEYSIGFIGNKKINFPFNTSLNNNYPTSNGVATNYFPYVLSYNYNDFSTDSTASNDFYRNNQIMGNYYAYDDGLAEAGFGVFGSGNKVALRFDIGSIVDTLMYFDIYFSPVVHDRSTERFQLTVWANDQINDIPGSIIYQKASFDRPKYSTFNIYKGINNFVRYELGQKVVVTGTFYVGWEKITEERMNIGYDVNINSQPNLFINVGDIWTVSDSSGGVVPGSIMLRPVFRKLKTPAVGQEDLSTATPFKAFPNPAGNEVFISSPHPEELNEIEIYDLSGKVLLKNRLTSNSISLSNLQPGIYLLRIINLQGQTLYMQKLVKN